jgi:phosphoserine phosphatase
VVAIDLDGTLLPGPSVLRLLASELGASCLVDRLERDFSAGTIGNERVADLTAALFRGARLRHIEGVLAAAQWLPGISDAVERLGQTGCRTLLATVTWSFAAEIVACRFGFDGCCGTRMNNVHGRLTGTVESYFRPPYKGSLCPGGVPPLGPFPQAPHRDRRLAQRLRPVPHVRTIDRNQRDAGGYQ